MCVCDACYVCVCVCMFVCACVANVCVCATLIGTRTGTRGFLRVEGIPDPATPAHGRAISGAGGAGFAKTIFASALVGCTDKHMGFRHSPASNKTGLCIVISYSPNLTFVPLGLVCNVGVIPNCHILTQ